MSTTSRLDNALRLPLTCQYSRHVELSKGSKPKATAVALLRDKEEVPKFLVMAVTTLQAKPVAHIVVGFRGHSVPAASCCAALFLKSLPGLSLLCVCAMYVASLARLNIRLLNNDPWEPREDRCFSSIYVLAATFHSLI